MWIAILLGEWIRINCNKIHISWKIRFKKLTKSFNLMCSCLTIFCCNPNLCSYHILPSNNFRDRNWFCMAFAYCSDRHHYHKWYHPPRTAPVFGSGGHAYVYLCYGLHMMLNVVTDKEGVGVGVLIRSCALIPAK